MVFFNCGTCGESMKKSQVEKHYKFKCRNCQCLSCVDCGKEFWGDDYTNHTKCISEDEKYGGKDYKPKPNANKGEKKQEEWTEQVQSAINKCKSNPKLRSLLVKLKDYSNIPRKKAKFENFVKNSLRIQSVMATQMWDAIAVEIHTQKMESQTENGSMKTNDKKNVDSESYLKNSSHCEDKQESYEHDTTNSVDKKKLSKRERKEERRKNKHKEEKKEKSKKLVQQRENKDMEENGISGVEKKKKKRKHKENDNEREAGAIKNGVTDGKKKRKHEEIDAEQESEEITKETGNLQVTDIKMSKKRKKYKYEEDEKPAQKKIKKFDSYQNESPASQGTEEDEMNPKVQEKHKFRWEKAIVKVLKKADDNQLPLKKLRKKVIAEYYACNPNDHFTEEQVLCKFNKKISKNSKLKVHKEKVKLIS